MTGNLFMSKYWLSHSFFLPTSAHGAQHPPHGARKVFHAFNFLPTQAPSLTHPLLPQHHATQALLNVLGLTSVVIPTRCGRYHAFDSQPPAGPGTGSRPLVLLHGMFTAASSMVRECVL